MYRPASPPPPPLRCPCTHVHCVRYKNTLRSCSNSSSTPHANVCSASHAPRSPALPTPSTTPKATPALQRVQTDVERRACVSGAWMRTHLAESRMVAQVDEYHAAVVAVLVYPPAQRHATAHRHLPHATRAVAAAGPRHVAQRHGGRGVGGGRRTVRRRRRAHVQRRLQPHTRTTDRTRRPVMRVHPGRRRCSAHSDSGATNHAEAVRRHWSTSVTSRGSPRMQFTAHASTRRHARCARPLMHLAESSGRVETRPVRTRPGARRPRVDARAAVRRTTRPAE